MRENRVKGQQEWNTRLAQPHGRDPVRAPVEKAVSQIVIWLSLAGLDVDEGMRILAAAVRERLAANAGFKDAPTHNLLGRLGIGRKQFEAGRSAKDFGDYQECLKDGGR